MLRSIGWALLIGGILAMASGYPRVMGSGFWWVSLGGASAHVGFFFILFGWLGEKIDGLKAAPPE